MSVSPTSIVATLTEIELPDLFNPYTDLDPLHDLSDAPARRRQNLLLYLQQLKASKPTELWVAESGSHTGTRRSGLPLVPTTEVEKLNERFGVRGFLTATKGEDRGGMTASYVWQAALKRPQLPLFWNAVMAHPHRPGQPYRNRPTRRTELRAYRPALAQLLALCQPSEIVAIGRVAETMLREMGVAFRYVRHPAQGGAGEFRRAIEQ